MFLSGQKRGVTNSIEKALKRRRTIEPEIEPMKSDGRLKRNDLKGDMGDMLNVVLCATLAEKKSRLYLVRPVANKTEQTENDAIVKLLTPIKHWVKTLTFGNGRAFNWHEKLAEKLECSTYFAKP